MTLDEKIKEKLEKYVKGGWKNCLDVRMRIDFLKILKSDDPQKLQEEVTYCAKGKLRLNPPKVIECMGMLTVESTYEELIEYLENGTITYAEGGGKLSI